MDNRLLSYMTILVVGLIAVLLALNLMPIFWTPMGEKYIGFNEVRGIAVEHDGKPYTLNFEQQNSMIKYLNQSIPVAPTAMVNNSTPVDFDKIIIYRFDNKSNITLTPLAYENNGNLFFKVTDWNERSILKDVSGGKLKEIINQTFNNTKEKKDTSQ